MLICVDDRQAVFTPCNRTAHNKVTTITVRKHRKEWVLSIGEERGSLVGGKGKLNAEGVSLLHFYHLDNPGGQGTSTRLPSHAHEVIGPRTTGQV